MKTNENLKTRRSSARVYYASAVALLGGVCMGAVIGYTSPALPSMSRNTTDADGNPGFRVDEHDTGVVTWIGSCMTLGALVGGLIAGPLGQGIGRKWTLTGLGAPFLVSWLLIGFAQSALIVILGRIVAGFAAGLASGIAPLYVIEIASPDRRGLLGTCFQVCVTIGIFLEALFGYFLEWRWLAFISSIPAIIMTFGMFFMDETPAWLLANEGRDSEKAVSVLRSLRDTGSDVTTELEELHSGAKQASSMWLPTSELKQPGIWKPAVLAFALMFFQQFSGINAVMFYQTTILEGSGLQFDPAIGTIISCFAQVLATICGSLIVDRVGRRILLMISGTGHAVSLAAFGAYYALSKEGDESVIPLLCLVLYIVSFSIGWGPIPWMMIPEMTPSVARSMISAIATALNWFSAFIVTKNFQTLINLIDKQGVYWIFSFICIGSVIFTVFALPETKGKTLDQIQRGFTSKATVGAGRTGSDHVAAWSKVNNDDSDAPMTA